MNPEREPSFKSRAGSPPVDDRDGVVFDVRVRIGVDRAYVDGSVDVGGIRFRGRQSGRTRTYAAWPERPAVAWGQCLEFAGHQGRGCCLPDVAGATHALTARVRVPIPG